MKLQELCDSDLLQGILFSRKILSIDGWMDRYLDGWMGGWMDGFEWMGNNTSICFRRSTTSTSSSAFLICCSIIVPWNPFARSASARPVCTCLSQSACSTANSFLFISIWLSAVFLSFDDDQHDDDNDYQFDDYEI